jgi:hypothetical protein
LVRLSWATRYGEAPISLRYAVRAARLAHDPLEVAQPELSEVA